MADISVQRGQATIASGGTSVTITAGTDYTAPSSITKSFIRIVSALHVTDGSSTEFGGQVDENTAVISNPGNLLTSITFTRPASPSKALNIEWEIWEYTGSAGGENEFKVLGQEVLTLSGVTTADSTSWTATNGADVVPFITSQSCSDISSARGEVAVFMHTADWISASNLIRVTRGSSAREAKISVAAVEFIGSSWTIQKVNHTFTSQATDETATITAIAGTDKAFTHLQYRSADLAFASEMGIRAWLSSTTQATFYADYVNTGQNATLWIAENSGLSVEQKSGTWASSATDPDTLDVSVTAVSATADTAITGVCATIGASNENDSHQLMMGARLTSTNNVRLFRGISDRQRVYRFEVAQFPTAGGGPNIINRNLSDNFDIVELLNKKYLFLFNNLLNSAVVKDFSATERIFFSILIDNFYTDDLVSSISETFKLLVDNSDANDNIHKSVEFLKLAFNSLSADDFAYINRAYNNNLFENFDLSDDILVEIATGIINYIKLSNGVDISDALAVENYRNFSRILISTISIIDGLLKNVEFFKLLSNNADLKDSVLPSLIRQLIYRILKDNLDLSDNAIKAITLALLQTGIIKLNVEGEPVLIDAIVKDILTNAEIKHILSEIEQ